MDNTLHSVASIFEAASLTISTKDQYGSPAFTPGTWENVLASLESLNLPNVQTRGGKLGDSLGITGSSKFTVEPTSSPKIEINEPWIGYMIENFSLITFNSLYPTVITILLEEGAYPAISPFKEMYYVIKHRPELKKLQASGAFSERGNLAVKMWINYAYGKLKNYNVESGLVTGYVHAIFENLKYRANRWYYIDTDEIWLRMDDKLTREHMVGYLNSLGISYEIENVDFFTIMAKKKFVASVENKLISKGFRREAFLG